MSEEKRKVSDNKSDRKGESEILYKERNRIIIIINKGKLLIVNNKKIKNLKKKYLYIKIY